MAATVKDGAIVRIQEIWNKVVSLLDQRDFCKGAPRDILPKLKKVTFDVNPHVNFFELNGETSRVVFHPDFLIKIQDTEQIFLEHFLILFLVHEFYHPEQGINSYNYKGIGRTGFTMGMDEYADSMACFVATMYHLRKKEEGKNGKEREKEEENNNNNVENNRNGGEEEENNRNREEDEGNNRRERRRMDREIERKKRREDKEKAREEKQKRKTIDYRDAYFFCWDVIVQSIALFDEYPLSDPPLSRVNRYLTTLLHRHLAKRATTYRLLKSITKDRWQIGFCGVAKKQNEEEDQIVDVEETKKRSADLYFMYSVNGGAETKKLLRDPQNLEPMWILECLLEGKFNDNKVTKALDYMLQNGINNYRTSPSRRLS